MAPSISRHTFLRFVLGAAGAAIVGGCADVGASSFGQRGPTRRSGSSDPTDPTDDGDPADGGIGDPDAGTDPAEVMTDASTADPPIVDSGAAPDDAAANACTQALMLTNANGGITSAHAHAFTIAAADFLSTTSKTYTMNGGHAHDVTLTPAQLTKLRAGGTVNVTSTSTNGHTHACTIKCA